MRDIMSLFYSTTKTTKLNQETTIALFTTKNTKLSQETTRDTGSSLLFKMCKYGPKFLSQLCSLEFAVLFVHQRRGTG